MKPDDGASRPDERDELDELWDGLKQMDPPLETRVAIRASVVRELARVSSQGSESSVPFLWRSVAIPWPVVAAAIALLLGLSASHFQGMAVTNQVNHHEDAKHEVALEVANPKRPAREPSTRLVTRQTMTYLCGIGTLHTETTHLPQEVD